MKYDLKRLGHIILCLLTPWLASSVLYFASRSQWWAVLGMTLFAGSICMLGLEGVMRPYAHSSDHSLHQPTPTLDTQKSVSESAQK